KRTRRFEPFRQVLPRFLCHADSADAHSVYVPGLFRNLDATVAGDRQSRQIYAILRTHHKRVEESDVNIRADSNPATETLFKLAPAVQKVWTIKASLGAVVLVAGVFVFDVARVVTHRGVLPFAW